MNYTEKLKDPRWQKKRLKVLERDKFTCRYCYDNETTLHVHHIQYNKEPWTTALKHLITLCKNCHSLVEACKKHNIDIDLPVLKYSMGKDDEKKAVYFVRSPDNLVKIFIQNGYYFNPLPIGIPQSVLSEVSFIYCRHDTKD